MTLYCRCDHPDLKTDGITCRCGHPERSIEISILHKPPPPFSLEPNPEIVEAQPWKFCPGCGCGPGIEHDKQCVKASWNQPTYRARKST
jgi:hypothetical protein